MSEDNNYDEEFIRVSVRVRPTKNSCEENFLCVDQLNRTIEPMLSNKSRTRSLFQFDNVFDESTSQVCEIHAKSSICSSKETMFGVLGRRIIESCVAGYNGTIFAYGQTGSGKTYTMVGPGIEDEEGQLIKDCRGLIPRCVDSLFTLLERKQEEKTDSFQFVCKCSFVELYNEKLYDLLDENADELKLREDMKLGVRIQGAVDESVSSAFDAHQVLSRGWTNRRIGSTQMNRQSSRSHAVFILEIETQETDAESGLVNHKTSRLNMVDLAGSEKQKDSKSEGDRFKEAVHINQSLSVLGQVIRSLSSRALTFVPYRTSKLTFLLRDSLGGNARTVLVANVHPDSSFCEETMSTLMFAQDVKKVRNRVVANEQISGENVEALQREIGRLKAELRQFAAIDGTESLDNLPSSDVYLREQYKQAVEVALDYQLKHHKLKQRMDQWQTYIDEKDAQLVKYRVQVQIQDQTIRGLHNSLTDQSEDSNREHNWLAKLQTNLTMLEQMPKGRLSGSTLKVDDENEWKLVQKYRKFGGKSRGQLDDEEHDSEQLKILDEQLELRRLKDTISQLDFERDQLKVEFEQREQEHLSEIERLKAKVLEAEQVRKTDQNRRLHLLHAQEVAIKTLTPPRPIPMIQSTPTIVTRSMLKDRRQTIYTPKTGPFGDADIHPFGRINASVEVPDDTEEHDQDCNQLAEANTTLRSQYQALEIELEHEEQRRLKVELELNQMEQIIRERNSLIDQINRETGDAQARLVQQNEQLHKRFNDLQMDSKERHVEMNKVRNDSTKTRKELDKTERELARMQDMYDLRRRELDDVYNREASLLEKTVFLDMKIDSITLHLNQKSDRLAEELAKNANLVGHSNEQQRIKYVDGLRVKNAQLEKEISALKAVSAKNLRFPKKGKENSHK